MGTLALLRTSQTSLRETGRGVFGAFLKLLHVWQTPCVHMRPHAPRGVQTDNEAVGVFSLLLVWFLAASAQPEKVLRHFFPGHGATTAASRLRFRVSKMYSWVLPK